MLRYFVVLVMMGGLLSTPVLAEQIVVMETSQGVIKLALDDQKAPLTVANFLAYADTGFYEGTVFHRVIKDFMIQGGGYDTALKRKQTKPPVKNEATNGLKNKRGTIAMARTRDINSATSQFFINTKDNVSLDHRDMGAGYGYAVFGRVIEGMAVVDQISNSATRMQNALFRDLPVETVVIKSVKRQAAQ